MLIKKILLILFFCGATGTVFARAQSVNSFQIFLHAGFGILPDKISELTSSSAGYIDKLRSETVWNAQAYYRHKKLMIGFLYSNYTVSGSLKHGQDKILPVYTGPQLGINIPVFSGKFDIVFNTGIGGMWYRDRSSVFKRDRVVKESTVGANLGLKGVYNFTRNFGVSIEVLAVRANLFGTDVKDHDQAVDMKYFDALHRDQFTFSVGLKCAL